MADYFIRVETATDHPFTDADNDVIRSFLREHRDLSIETTASGEILAKVHIFDAMDEDSAGRRATNLVRQAISAIGRSFLLDEIRWEVANKREDTKDSWEAQPD